MVRGSWYKMIKKTKGLIEGNMGNCRESTRGRTGSPELRNALRRQKQRLMAYMAGKMAAVVVGASSARFSKDRFQVPSTDLVTARDCVAINRLGLKSSKTVRSCYHRFRAPVRGRWVNEWRGGKKKKGGSEECREEARAERNPDRKSECSNQAVNRTSYSLR